MLSDEGHGPKENLGGIRAQHENEIFSSVTSRDQDQFLSLAS